MLRKGLIACFSDSSVYRIAGEADNIENAKKVVASYKPETDASIPAVAIVDVGFSSNVNTPETVQGFELVKYINQTGKNIKCVMFSSLSRKVFQMCRLLLK